MHCAEGVIYIYEEGWKMYKSVIKRVVDAVLSLMGLIVLIPVFIVTSIAIYIDDPGPVIFKQQRMGKDKKPFWLYKFRSMKMDTPQIPGYLFDNADTYITKVGRIIRRLSIDELPQIYNIFLGNMSIIGYRPSLYENEDELVNKRDKYNIHSIKPGLTGWAQINGRDAISVDAKVEFDRAYAEILNNGGMAAVMMDVKCFFGTIKKVLKREDVVEGVVEEHRKEVVYK